MSGSALRRNWVSVALLVCAGALLAAVAADAAGVPYVRPVVAALVLSTAGGLAVAALTGAGFDRAESVVYAVGASIVSVMLLGVLLNVLFAGGMGGRLGVKPFVPATLVAAITAALLAGALALRGRAPIQPPAFDYRALLAPAPLFLLNLPLLGVVGALLDRWYEIQTLRLATIALVALVPLGLLVFRTAKRYATLAVYAGAVALFYGTTLSTQYFSGGDASIEYYFANRVIDAGVWMPTFTGTKTSLLSLVVVHPIYTLVGNVELIATMKVIYPLLFAFTPVALYLAARRLFDHPTALLAAFLVTFLHPYFRLLTQNTRSGTAILFVACFALLAVDRVRGSTFTAYATIFLFGVVVSHYGVIAMFLVMVALAYVTGLLDRYVRWSTLPDQRLRYPTVLFLVVLFLAWYIYTASTVNFYRLVNVAVNDVALGLDDMFSSGSNATQAVRIGFQSLTYRLIRLEYIVVTLVSGFGFLHVSLASPLFDSLERFRPVAFLRENVDVPVHPSFHMFTAGANVLLLLAFAPVDLIGVARIYALAAIFIVPYGVFEARWWLGRLDFALPSSFRVPTGPVVAVAVAALLVVNSGLLSALVTNGRSPQPELERERIEATGTERELYHLNRHYTPPSDIAASGWIFRHSPAYDRLDRQIFAAGRHGGLSPRFYTTAEWAYHANPLRFSAEEFDAASDKYFLYSSYMHVSGNAILTQPSDGSFPYVTLTPVEELGLDDEHIVYTNGRARIYWSGEGPPEEGDEANATAEPPDEIGTPDAERAVEGEALNASAGNASGGDAARNGTPTETPPARAAG